MSRAREKFATQVDTRLLAEIRGLASQEGRQIQALVEEALGRRAQLREPLKIPYRGGTVFATPELTAGPTLAHALRLLQQEYRPGRAPDATTLRAVGPA